jgi:uncharacterized RDD family membrane protein YckC
VVTFRKIIDFLNRKKDIDIWGDRNEDLSPEDKEYIESIPSQNPYGIAGLIISGIAFAFPQFGISIITLIFCMVTIFTFEKEKEDNPWPFYLGIIISLIGLYMFIIGEIHHLII